MSLVTLETIKATVPTILPTIGTFLGRAVTIISNPTTQLILTIAAGILLIVWFVRAIKSWNEGRIAFNKIDEKIKATTQDLSAAVTQFEAVLDNIATNAEIVL